MPTNHAAENEVVLTFDGIRKLENELEQLKTVKRQEVSERIRVAISFGDISENAEYDEAKNEQAFLEGRILQLENMLRTAKVVSDDDVSTEVVNVGAKVTVVDIEYDEEMEYVLVGSAEADPIMGRISNESPLGRALLGKAPGDEVNAQVPDGIMRLRIVSIRKQ